MVQRTYPKCPFYISGSRDEKRQITITHELPEDNIGFDILSQIRFSSLRDRKDWIEIFCADRYEHCPFYPGILAKYEKGE